MSRTWNTRIEQNLHLPLKACSPWSLVQSTISRSEMREHANYSLYYRRSKSTDVFDYLSVERIVKTKKERVLSFNEYGHKGSHKLLKI